MRTRRFWSFFTVAAILCFLLATNSRGSEAVPVTEQYTQVHHLCKSTAGDDAPVLKAKTHLASGWYGISRRIQFPASFSERHTSHAHLSAFSFHWNTQQQKSTAFLSYDACDVFISRIRSLLYPKHSFW